MSLNDNKGRRHASIYLGDPPVSYGGGDRHSGDRGLCLVARRGIRRCPEMAEVAPSAQGPQGAIAQACQRARPVVANGALRGSSPGQARFDSVMRASAAHDRRPRAVRCSGGDRTRNWRRLASNVTRKASTTFATKVRLGFAFAGRTRSLTSHVSRSRQPQVHAAHGGVHAKPLLRRRLIAAPLPASRRQLVSRLEAAPTMLSQPVHAGIIPAPPLYCSRRRHSASTSAARESNQPECIRNISESCELGRVYTFRGKQK